MCSRSDVLHMLQVACGLINCKQCNYKKDYLAQMTKVAEDGVVLKAVKELSLSSNIILVDGSEEAEIIP